MASASIDSTAFLPATREAFTILVVEDQAGDTELMLNAIERADLKAIDCPIEFEVRATAEGALQVLAEKPVDLVVTDMMLPGMSGLDLVSQIQEIDRNLPVLVVTRMKGIPEAVDAMRRGAYDFILKPVNVGDLGMRLHRAIRMSEILRRSSAFERMARSEMRTGQLVGASAAFQSIIQCIYEASQVRSTILITGETGTGKGLIARAIHEQSQERDKPFQVIDCTTVPEGMMESELFGHVRGAFTGAVSDKPGLIELADGGSVFLDEIGDLPLPLQAKLLRVLEENEVRPVGGTLVKRVNMRFIAATNQNLESKVREGTFRKDLYYRLAVLTISVPPLRERTEDIPAIARQLLADLGREMGKSGASLDASAMGELVAYRWPGNVRELRNVIERAMILSANHVIRQTDIRRLLSHEEAAATPGFAAYLNQPYNQAKQQLIEDFTADYLRSKLAVHQDCITQAAAQSGMPRQNFSRLMKRYLGQE